MQRKRLCTQFVSMKSVNVYRRTNPFEDPLRKTSYDPARALAWVALDLRLISAGLLENARKNSLGTAKRARKPVQGG